MSSINIKRSLVIAIKLLYIMQSNKLRCYAICRSVKIFLTTESNDLSILRKLYIGLRRVLCYYILRFKSWDPSTVKVLRF